jgi:photosystem II stability/assembly factor-like uncharacterized protein
MVSGIPGSSTVLAGVAKRGLWANTNGSIWSQLGNASGSNPIAHRPSWIQYDPNNPRTFWVSGIYGGNVYKTTDGGGNFQALGSATHNDHISVDHTDPNRQTLLAGGHDQARTIWRSTNGGQTWANIGGTLPTGLGFTTHPIVINAQTYLINSHPGGGPSGIYRTTNGGTSWTRVSQLGPIASPLVASNGAIYWPTNNGLAKSTDRGATWSNEPDGIQAVTPVELPDGRIVAIGSFSLVISSNGGESWTSLGPDFPFTPRSLAYSSGRKAFFISYWDCTDRVLPNAVMQIDLT